MAHLVVYRDGNSSASLKIQGLYVTYEVAQKAVQQKFCGAHGFDKIDYQDYIQEFARHDMIEPKAIKSARKTNVFYHNGWKTIDATVFILEMRELV